MYAQNGLGDLQEDLVSKLDKFWEHNAKDHEAIRSEASKLELALREDFVCSDEHLMSLIKDGQRDFEVALTKVESTALKDLADTTQAIEDLQDIINSEKKDVRGIIDSAVRVSETY